MADQAARVGSDEKRLSRTIVRINTIEATSPLNTGEHMDESSLPTALVPSEPESPDAAYERCETRDRVRTAIQSLPWRERKVIGLYYYAEATMKQIGAAIGVNESRVSQLHARAIQRLKQTLGADCSLEDAARALRPDILSFQQSQQRMTRANAAKGAARHAARTDAPAVVLAYKPSPPKPAPVRRSVNRDTRAMAAAR
jgi:RNA polymerase sigma factor for flagellar operon FliA